MRHPGEIGQMRATQVKTSRIRQIGMLKSYSRGGVIDFHTGPVLRQRWLAFAQHQPVPIRCASPTRVSHMIALLLWDSFTRFSVYRLTYALEPSETLDVRGVTRKSRSRCRPSCIELFFAPLSSIERGDCKINWGTGAGRGRGIE